MLPRWQHSTSDPDTYSSIIRTGTVPRRSERSQQRIRQAVPLLVSGLGVDGRLFHELSSTHDVSQSGCRIHVNTRPQPDSPLALRFIRLKNAIEEKIQVLFEVAWVKTEGTGWAVGAQCLGACDFRALLSHGNQAQ